MKLTLRQEQILRIIVEEYIKTGVPVGSRTILDAQELDCSSATVRNECVSLEEQELLEKTHSSSGRVPSTKGYRYYVDKLMSQNIENDIIALKTKITALFNTRDMEINEIITKTGSILSEMTNLISIVIGPNSDDDTLKRIELIPLSNDNALAIIITNNGHIENKVFNINEVALADLTIAIDVFNQRLVGTKINEVVEKVNLLKPLLQNQVRQSEYIIQSFVNAILTFSKPLLSTHGIQYMLDNPEFSDLKKIKNLINFVESQSPWMYFDKLSRDKVQIKIGDELGLDNQDISLMTTSFKAQNNEQGQIVIVGPKRIEYEKINEILNWMADTINQKFN